MGVIMFKFIKNLIKKKIRADMEEERKNTPQPQAPVEEVVSEETVQEEFVQEETDFDGRVDEMVDTILRHEGGYVNHPNDRGGATNFGVTQKTLESWRKAPVSIEDVKNLTVEEARLIYKTNYFLGPKLDKLPVAIQPQMFDMSINHGAGRAIKILQKTVNTYVPTSIDGGIGPQTIKNTNKCIELYSAKKLNNKMVDNRILFFESIVRNNESQRVFLKGWIKRAKTFYI